METKQTAAEWLEAIAADARAEIVADTCHEPCGRDTLVLLAMLHDAKAEMKEPFQCERCDARAAKPWGRSCDEADDTCKWHVPDMWDAIESAWEAGKYN